MPHDVAAALTQKRRSLRAWRYAATGAAGLVVAALCVLYGAIALPVLAYASAAPPSAGHCRGTAAVAAFGVTGIAAVLRCGVSVALIGATNVGFEAFGLHTLPPARAPAAIVLHYVAQLLAALALLTGVIMAAVDVHHFIVVARGSSPDVTMAGRWGSECEWLFGVLPTLASFMFGAYAAVTLGVAALRHH